VILVVLIYGIFLLAFRPLLNHDTLIYALQGNALYDTKNIVYSNYVYLESVNMNKASMHAYGYPMFKLIENMFNIHNQNSDLYYRSVSIVNAEYLIILVYLFLKNFISKYDAFYTSYLISLSGIYIFLTATYGSGTISYVFLVLNVIFAYLMIVDYRNIYLVIFAISSGLGATIHSVNFILFPVFLMILFFLLKNNYYQKSYIILKIFILNLIFGSIHYYLEIIYGNGWIFGNKQNILIKIYDLLNSIQKLLL
jgi:hypothetical protein